jgi:hypothetical protein
VKKIALAAATIGAVIAIAPATAAAPTLGPHVWRTTITGAPVPLLNATWVMAFKNTAFNLRRNGGVVVAGTVKIAGNKVTLHDLAGTLSCKGTQINGTYGWKITGAKLKLTRFSDTCVGRRSVLSYAFTRIT